MVFEVPESVARTELPGGGLPPDARAVCHVAIVVPSRLPQLAEAPVDRRRVKETAGRPPGDPETGGEPAAQGFLGHLPVARGPVRPRTLKRPVREVGPDAEAER